MNSKGNLYHRSFGFVSAVFRVFYRITVSGSDNVQDGAAIVCANHSSWMDPVLLGLAFGTNDQLHFMAKAELFEKPVIGALIKKLGMFAVHRGENDMNAIRTAMKYLKNDEKIGIFPEGTRLSQDDMISAKSGAVRLADKMKVPVYPVYLPRKKRIFSKLEIIIGKPYYVERTNDVSRSEENTRLASELMGKIKALNPKRSL